MNIVTCSKCGEPFSDRALAIGETRGPLDLTHGDDMQFVYVGDQSFRVCPDCRFKPRVERNWQRQMERLGIGFKHTPRISAPRGRKPLPGQLELFCD